MYMNKIAARVWVDGFLTAHQSTFRRAYALGSYSGRVSQYEGYMLVNVVDWDETDYQYPHRIFAIVPAGEFGTTNMLGEYPGAVAYIRVDGHRDHHSGEVTWMPAYAVVHPQQITINDYREV